MILDVLFSSAQKRAASTTAGYQPAASLIPDHSAFVHAKRKAKYRGKRYGRFAVLHQAAVSFAISEALLDPNAARLEGLHTKARSRAAFPFAQQTQHSFPSPPEGRLSR